MSTFSLKINPPVIPTIIHQKQEKQKKQHKEKRKSRVNRINGSEGLPPLMDQNTLKMSKHVSPPLRFTKNLYLTLYYHDVIFFANISHAHYEIGNIKNELLRLKKNKKLKPSPIFAHLSDIRVCA